MADIQILQQRDDGSRICGLGVPLNPAVDGDGALTNMSKLVVLLEERLENLIGFTTAVPGVDEVQLVTISGNPSTGTFTLGLSIPGGGGTTTAIRYNPVVSDIESALTSLPGVNVMDIDVSQESAGVFAVTFQSGLGSQDITLMTANASFNKGTVTTSVDTPGAAPGAGVTAKSGLDSGGALLLTLIDGAGQQWVYRVFPAITLGGLAVAFLGELAEGNPNAWAPVGGVQEYPPTELEWREATVVYRAPVGSPPETHIQGLQVKRDE